MTTDRSVTQATDTREAAALGMADALRRINDLPAPQGIRAGCGSVFIEFDALTDAMPWVYALGLTADGDIRRRAGCRYSAAYSGFQGTFDGIYIDLYVCESVELIDVPLVTAAEVLAELLSTEEPERTLIAPERDVETHAGTAALPRRVSGELSHAPCGSTLYDASAEDAAAVASAVLSPDEPITEAERNSAALDAKAAEAIGDGAS